MSDKQTVVVHGNEVELHRLEAGATCTDVMIMTRTVFLDENGELQDALQLAYSANTTALIRTGMTAATAHIESSAWGRSQ